MHSGDTIPACDKDTSVNTDNGYNYKNTDLDLSKADGIVFKVKACNDAHIILSTSTNFDNNMYEIALGGWQNTASIIR